MILPPPLRRPLPTLPPRKSLRNRDTERLRLSLLLQSYPPPPVDTEWSRYTWELVIAAAVAMLFVAMALGGG